VTDRKAADAEQETRAKIAADLRRAADGRREYGETSEADAFESAAAVAEDPARLLGLIPSWRWTAEEQATELHRKERPCSAEKTPRPRTATS
jgi:hypothetical protein